MDGSFKDDIKFNCDVSDARFWGYFSICGLLLRYRDLYRSENNLKPWTNISRTDIAAWIHAKEARWPDLEHREFRELTIDGRQFRPFDVEAINHALGPHVLVYGAGYGMYMKPTFFLAELRSSREIDGLKVLTSGFEFVRDLFSAPAMLQQETVFLRLEPLLILLHYKFSELISKRNTALEDAFTCYGFRHRQLTDETLEKRLEELALRYADVILYHEIGEYKEGLPEWKQLLAAAGDRKNEHYLRAIKDLIADTSDFGPLKRIIETKDRGALGISVALMEGFQKVLFPDLKDAYHTFIKHEDWDVIEKVRNLGYTRFVSEREHILCLFRENRGEEGFSARLRKNLPV